MLKHKVINLCVYFSFPVSMGLVIVIVFLAGLGLPAVTAFTVWEFPTRQATQSHALVMETSLGFVVGMSI